MCSTLRYGRSRRVEVCERTGLQKSRVCLWTLFALRSSHVFQYWWKMCAENTRFWREVWKLAGAAPRGWCIFTRRQKYIGCSGAKCAQQKRELWKLFHLSDCATKKTERARKREKAFLSPSSKLRDSRENRTTCVRAWCMSPYVTLWKSRAEACVCLYLIRATAVSSADFYLGHLVNLTGRECTNSHHGSRVITADVYVRWVCVCHFDMDTG